MNKMNLMNGLLASDEKKKTMKRLQYQFARYRALGNGPKCQQVQSEMNKLLAIS
ncbi:MAG TPA: hypothetical protein PLK40_03840 [Bacteroidaceae bacterium]|nr:hypothetical protein [Bacteroidaceae bacterium]